MHEMASLEDHIKSEGSNVGNQTLAAEMKLLKEMQYPSGAPKALNSELWHACAGPLVSLPQMGSFVYYFPQGHSEQVAASTRRTATSQIPNYPNLPSELLCQLQNVTLHADKDTDEIYAQMRLQPLNSETDVVPVSEFGIKLSKHPSEFFCKTLTASDTSTHGGFSVPRRAAEKLFPPLDYTVQPPSQEIVVRDLHDNTWAFRHIYRGQPKRHLLTTGWSSFVGSKRLKAGDAVLFIRDEKSQLLVGVRHANGQLTTLPSSVISTDSMHIGVLAAAAHALANRTPFTIFYNPRACPSEFVVPLAKYRKAVYGTQLSVGTRFGMMFETEESSKRRYMGTIVGISDLDPLRWPGSKWRNIQVEWDEAGCGNKQNRVSSWEIETPENLLIFPSLTSTLKRPLHSGILGVENEWGTLLRRPFMQVHENGNMELSNTIANLHSEHLMKFLFKTLPVNSPGNSSSLAQEAKTTPAEDSPKTHLACSESIPIQGLHHSQPFPDQSNAVNLHSLLQGDQPGKLHSLGKIDNPPSSAGITDKSTSESEVLTDHMFGFPSMEGCNVVKNAANSVNPQSLASHLTFFNQNQSPWPTLPQKESSISLSQLVDVHQFDSSILNGLFPELDIDEWMVNSYQPCPGPLSASQEQSALLSLAANNTPLPSRSPELWDHQVKNLKISPQSEQFMAMCQKGLYSHSGVYNSVSDVSNNAGRMVDPSTSSTILDEFCTLKEVKFQNPSDCVVSNISSSQDVQSQITSASLVETRAFSLHDNSGGTSSSQVDFDESSFLQNSSWQQASAPMRTYTKVRKAGCVGRSIDVTTFKNYEELITAIECMFGLEGLPNDTRGSGWKLVYVDYENDVLLVGDDPWEEFVGCVRCIRILSPSEVEQMSEEGMKLLDGAAVQGINGSISGGLN